MFKISKELLQAIINYLTKQPYAEVVGLLNALLQCGEIKEEEDGELQGTRKEVKRPGKQDNKGGGNA